MEIYLSYLKDYKEIHKLSQVRKVILYQILEGYESLYSMSRSATRKYIFQRDDGATVEFSKLNLTPDAVKAAVKKLEREGLVRKVKQKEKENTLSGWELFAANQRKPNHYCVTEYGLFCILSHEFEHPYKLLSNNWDSTVVQTLVAPYFSKDTIKHATLALHLTVVKFVNESCRITSDILKNIRAREQKGMEISRYVKKLERDLLVHAKLFALHCVLRYITRDKQLVDSSDLDPVAMQMLMRDSQFRRFLGSTLEELSAVYKMFDKAQKEGN